jgi:hypothetical protein
MEPFEPGLQLELVMIGFNTTGGLQLKPQGVSCTIVVKVDVHAFASVSVTEKLPSVRPFKSSLVAPLFHKKVRGAVAPETFRFIVPLLETQKLLVLTDEIEIVKELLIVMDEVAIQLSKLVTVTT